MHSPDDVRAAFGEWAERQKIGRSPAACDALNDAVAALDDIFEGAMQAGPSRVRELLEIARAVNAAYDETDE